MTYFKTAPNIGLKFLFLYKTLTLIAEGRVYYQSEGGERISAPPGHVISQGLAPGTRVVTCRRGGSTSLERQPNLVQHA